ncbi:Malate synthase, partial [mine drainage metagenome]
MIADGEAGFGGPINVFEIAKWMIESGASGVHFEDQLSSEKKCGHLGGKVLINTPSAIRNLVSARLASDVLGIDTIIIARTDALNATLITNDISNSDTEFILNSRTHEGFYKYQGCLDAAIKRGIDFAPYADMLWFETSRPDMDEAKKFAKAIHSKFPGKKLAYNCSPSFNWEQNLNNEEISMFQEELGELGYRF